MAKAKQPERRTRIIGATVLFDNATCSVPVNGKLWNVYHHATDGKLLFAPIGGCTKSEILELPLAPKDVVKIVKASKGKGFLGSKENAIYLKALATIQDAVSKKSEMSKSISKPATKATKLKKGVIPAVTLGEMEAPPFDGRGLSAILDTIVPVPLDAKRSDVLEIAISIARAVIETLEKLNLGKK